jgi:hypothetical protein
MWGSRLTQLRGGEARTLTGELPPDLNTNEFEDFDRAVWHAAVLPGIAVIRSRQPPSQRQAVTAALALAAFSRSNSVTVATAGIVPRRRFAADRLVPNPGHSCRCFSVMRRIAAVESPNTLAQQSTHHPSSAAGITAVRPTGRGAVAHNHSAISWETLDPCTILGLNLQRLSGCCASGSC